MIKVSFDKHTLAVPLRFIVFLAGEAWPPAAGAPQPVAMQAACSRSWAGAGGESGSQGGGSAWAQGEGEAGAAAESRRPWV